MSKTFCKISQELAYLLSLDSTELYPVKYVQNTVQKHRDRIANELDDIEFNLMISNHMEMYVIKEKWWNYQ
jgi:hypothetical protein